jgi:hypothetical protein
MNNSWNITAPDGSGLSVQQFQTLNGHPLAFFFGSTVVAWQSFVNNHGVVVWAAGNESAAQPDAFAGLPLQVSALQPGWASVVAVNPNGTLASYSNQCGQAAQWCLAAVGGPVSVAVSRTVSPTGYNLSASSSGGYSGTSFAAPAVSGAIALLMSAAPNITAQQALQILFQTANKSGAYAQSAIFGQGVMDLNQAMQPVGQVVVAGKQIATAAAASSFVSLGGAFGGGPTQALAGTPMIVQDSFSRGFELSLGSRVSPGPSDFDAVDRLAVFGRPDTLVFADAQSRITLVEDADPRSQIPDGLPSRFIGERQVFGDTVLRFGAGVDPGRLLPGGHDSVAADYETGLLLPGSVGNPYLALIDQPSSGAADFRFGSTRVTVAATAGNSFVPSGLFDYPGAQLPRIAAGEVEATRPIGEASLLRFESGVMNESGTMLGSLGAGATQFGNSRTWFSGMEEETRLTDQTAFAIGLHAGMTSSSGFAGSVIREASDVVSLSGGFGLVMHDAFGLGDKLTIGAGMPLNAVSGHADLLLPSLVNLDGSVETSRVRIGMRADGHEIDIPAGWSLRLRPDLALTSGFVFRRDPDNIRGAAPDTVAAVRADLRF